MYFLLTHQILWFALLFCSANHKTLIIIAVMFSLGCKRLGLLNAIKDLQAMIECYQYGSLRKCGLYQYIHINIINIINEKCYFLLVNVSHCNPSCKY